MHRWSAAGDDSATAGGNADNIAAHSHATAGDAR
jgi:hypothetical protein